MGATRGRGPAEADWRALLDAVSDGVALCRRGRIAWANARLAALAGREKPEELLGTPLHELFVECDAGLPRSGRIAERRLARPDGEKPVVEVVRLSGRYGAGLTAFLVREVGPLRTLEAEMLRAGRELHAANRERVALRERLREEARSREEILTFVSHELRTPVTVIAGYNRLLLSGKVGPLTAAQRRFLEESQKSCQRLNAFIGNLLESARQTVGQGALEVCEGPLAPTVQTVIDLLAPLAREQRIELRARIDPAVPPARFDPPRIEQVLTNLIGNAIKFGRAGGFVEVGVRERFERGRRWVEVAVVDDGPGVDPEDRERIFEPYVRAGEASQAGGLGLGLAICRRIVEAHGGTIAMRERPGGGSCFVFTLPAAGETGQREGGPAPGRASREPPGDGRAAPQSAGPEEPA